MAVLLLVRGLRYELFAPQRIYGEFYFPVFEMDKNGRSLALNCSIDTAGVPAAIFMTALWALWCTLLAPQTEGGIILFVISSIVLVLFMFYRKHADDDLLAGLVADKSAVRAACEFAIKAFTDAETDSSGRLIRGSSRFFGTNKKPQFSKTNNSSTFPSLLSPTLNHSLC